jgi:DNA polymerase-1
MSKDKNLVIIDGYGFIFRAFYSMPPLTTPIGSPIGAIYGFCSMLLRIINEMKFSHIVVALDSGSKTFRNELYPSYKANRSAPPDDLIPQFPIIRQAVETFNIVALEALGYEADDIIATLVRQAKEQHFKVTIVSSDKDLMQLIDENIQMFDGIKNTNIREEEVFAKFGVKPSQVKDVLSLIGDSSDNIPGVHGIGAKGAAELINKFGNLDNLLNNLEQVSKPKHRETLTQNAEIAKLSHQLVSLCDTIKLNIKLDDLAAKKPTREVVYNFFNELGFKTLISRVNFDSKEQRAQIKKEKIKYEIINSTNQLENLIKNAYSKGNIAIHLQKDSLKNITFVSLALDDNLAAIVEINKQNSLLSSSLDIDYFKLHLRKILLDDSLVIITHDAKSLFHFLFDNDSQYEKQDTLIYDDIMLMSYCLDNGRLDHDLTSMIFNHMQIDLKEQLKDSKSFLQLANETQYDVLACCATSILQISNLFKSRMITEKVLSLYKNIENPMSYVLYNIEREGIKISRAGLINLNEYFQKHINSLEDEIFKLAGYSLNIASPKQLSELLFDKLGYKTSEKTSKTKSNSTSAEVLEELASSGHEIASLILKWRMYSKLNSTYTTNLVNYADKKDRIHTTFQMSTTSTGRLSSVDPNLQNIPTRTEEGLKIRSNFIAEQDKILISADYSQIELRLLASIANVSSLIDAFKNNIDIHTKTAAEIFNLSLDQVTPELRRKAKTINFGIIYGISAFGLATRLNIPRSEAKEFIELYFSRYPEIKTYMEQTIEFARKNGYVSTIYGRKCYIPGINDKNFTIRGLSERAAINAPLQGSQADIIKKAMIRIDHKLKIQQLSSHVVLQIHDELLIESPLNEVDKVSQLVKKEMESVSGLLVPTTVDVHTGKNWGEL